MAKRKHNSVYQNRTRRKKAKQAAAPIERRVTRSMTTKVTRQAVFDTTELMENILAHLTPHDAIRAKEVCRRFNDVVTSSLLLHERLFLRRPPAQPPLRYRVVGKGTKSHFVVADGEADKAGSREFDDRPLLTVIQRNPFLFDLDDEDPRKLKARNVLDDGRDSLYMKWHLLDTLQGNFSGPVNEPWVNMLVSNPPVTSARVWFLITVGDIFIDGNSPPVQNANGLTMNDLLQAAFNLPSGMDRDGYGMWPERTLGIPAHVESGMALSELVANLEQEQQAFADWYDIQVVFDGTFVATEKEIKSIK
ncbi:hypothetical protein PRZ48_014950 [Zasmidium cellare]|uniref:F-box domain-containing protein n=1 Tax=Zasmidium cellare TaxID=395010 RepID=A0ABR0DXP5_ZASCE|nr:hypothetical protein PRZ48_014950 [Zasmidium cellare]